MTILLIHNHYQQHGGEDQVFSAERDLLRSHGHTVITYTQHNDRIHRLGHLRTAIRTLWSHQTVRDIRRLIHEHRPAVAHCHNTFPLISPSVFWTCRRARIPIVLTLHNYRLTCLNGYLFRDGKVCEECFGRFPWAGIRHRCYRGSLSGSIIAALSNHLHFSLLRTYHRCVHRFICLSEFGRQKMLALGLPEDKLVVKPNLVDLAALASNKAETPPSELVPATQADPVAPPSPATILFVGRLSSEKGVDILLRAWHLAAPHLPTAARLLIIGDGPERATLETLAQSTPLPHPISFTGRLPRAEVLQHLRNAAALVLPSLCYETFGLSVVEAFACGCPAIVSDHGPMADLVEEGTTGYRFAVGDPTALADKLTQALAAPAALAAMGQTARHHILSTPSSPDRNYALLMDIYTANRR